MNIPELSLDELGALRQSIQKDGVIYPVLLDRHGEVIDGNHRQKVCAELGIDCPTQTLDVDDETAARLRVSVNVARRQLTTLDKMEMIAWLAEQYAEDASAAALERMAQGGKGGLPEGRTGPVLPSGKAAEDIADRITKDAAKAGTRLAVSGSTIRRARKTAALDEGKKAQIRSGQTSVCAAIGESEATIKSAKKRTRVKNTGMLRDRPSRPQELGELARIRASDAAHQYNSMLNAPAAKLNLPLIRRAEKVMEMLTELIALDPAKAVSQLPIERCREFTVAHAAWWSEFTGLCEERRAAETPDLPPRPYRPRNNVLNPVVTGTAQIPLEEQGLAPAERAVLDWLRARTEPVTATEISVGLRNRSRQTINLKLRALRMSGLVEVVGKVGQELAYQATNGVSSEGEQA